MRRMLFAKALARQINTNFVENRVFPWLAPDNAAWMGQQRRESAAGFWELCLRQVFVDLLAFLPELPYRSSAKSIGITKINI